MTDGLNVELWTLPNSGNFVRIADVTKWIVAAELDVRYSDLSGGSVTFADGIPYPLIEVDPDDHTNDVGRTLMIFRDGVWLAAFVIVEEDDLASSELPVSTYVVEGVLDYFADRARVKAFDYPANPIREGDWLYGAPSILPPAGTQITNDRTEIWRSAGTSSGTFTITDGTDTTLAIAWNASAETVRTEIVNGITAVVDCAVAGDGSVDYPWAIELTDPSGTPIVFSIGTNSTNGVLSVNPIREGGDLSPSPYHGTVDATTNVRVGVYQEFAMVEAGVGGVPAAPAGSTSTHLLKLDPDTLRAAGDYAGFQVEPAITPGSRYRASVKAISPISPQRVRFVLRDLEENTLGWVETTVSTSWVTLTAVDVDGGAFIDFPEGIDVVVYRCGVIETDNADPVYFDVNEAILAPGDIAKPYGEISTELLAPMTTRNVLDWMLEGWTATLDSSAAVWDTSLAVGVRKGQSFLQWLEWGRDSGGYEWDLRYTGGTVTPFTLDLYNPGNGGTNLVGTGISISAVDGLVEQGSRIKRAPDATDAIAEGAEGRWGESFDANLRTGWGVLETYFANRQGRDGLAAIAARVVADSARESAGRKITTRNPKTTPLDTVKLGDTVTVVPQGEPPRAQRLVGVTISIDSQPAPEYDYHFDSLVFEPEAAQADAVRSLIRRFDALDQLGGSGGGARSLDVGATAASNVPTGGTTRPVIVAAFNAPQEWKDAAHYQCSGTSVSPTDLVEIQQAIDAQPNSQAHIRLSPGDFYIQTDDGSITTTFATLIEGSGSNVTNVYGRTGTDNGTTRYVFRLGGQGSILRDLGVGDWDFPASTTVYGVSMDSDTVRVERVYGWFGGDYQIAMQTGIENVAITGCVSTFDKGFVHAVGTAVGVNILDNHAQHGGGVEGTDASIRFTGGANNVQIVGNYLDSALTNNIIFAPDTTNFAVEILGNYMEASSGSSPAIYYATATSGALVMFTIVGNVFGSDTGMVVEGAAALGVQNLVFSNNVLGQVSRDELLRIECSGRNIVVADNVCEGTAIPITIGDGTATYDAVTVSGNHIEDNGTGNLGAGAQPAIKITNATNVLVANNRLSDISTPGIQLDGCDKGLVVGNYLEKWAATAALVLDADTNDIFVTANKVYPDAAVTAPTIGIHIANVNCDNNVVVGNDLRPGGTWTTAPIVDAGTGTLLDWPADVTYGDNFT